MHAGSHVGIHAEIMRMGFHTKSTQNHPPAPRCGNSDIGWVRGMARGVDGIRILGSGSRSGRGPSSGVQALAGRNPPCPSCRRIDPPTGWEGGFDPTAMGEELARGKELSIQNRNVGLKNVEK